MEGLFLLLFSPAKKNGRSFLDPVITVIFKYYSFFLDPVITVIFNRKKGKVFFRPCHYCHFPKKIEVSFFGPCHYCHFEKNLRCLFFFDPVITVILKKIEAVFFRPCHYCHFPKKIRGVFFWTLSLLSFSTEKREGLFLHPIITVIFNLKNGRSSF